MLKIESINGNYVKIVGKYPYHLFQIFSLSRSSLGMVIEARENFAKLLVSKNPNDVDINHKPEEVGDKNSLTLKEEHFGKIVDLSMNIIYPKQTPEEKYMNTEIGKISMNNNSPSIFDRVGLSEPIETGILCIDTMLPIGKGQRQLIVGDRQTGKTSICLSTMITQAKQGIRSIYVAIGQKRFTVVDIYEKLKEANVLDKVIILFSNPDFATEQFLIPKVGIAIAELLAYNGEDVLIVYDDFTKHANVYREISLSLSKTPGREAYPADIFFTHANILEKSGRFNEKYKNGSITALPIIQTIEGEVGQLIPSNIISITDGQIFTSSQKFNKGIFPAIDIGLSVSRTGSAVQSPLIKSASKGLLSEYTKLAELNRFAELTVNSNDDLFKKVKKYNSFQNMINQFGFNVYSPEVMVVIIKLFEMNFLSNIKDNQIFPKVIIQYSKIDPGAKKILKGIREGKLSKTNLEQMISAVYVPLIQTLSDIKGNLISQREIEYITGGEYEW